MWCVSCLRRLPLLCRTMRRMASATTWDSSRRFAPRCQTKQIADAHLEEELELAVELLQKLLRGEASSRRRRNVVQAHSFAEMLEQTIGRYQNRAL